MVYVLTKDDKPLMPTTRYGKVRRLLRDKKAKVVRREPFTIKLLYETETEIVQDCTLGVDTGSRYVGSAVYSEGKILYLAEVQIRDDVKTKMDRRKASRQNRRFRKTRYRKPRFLNRGNSKKNDRYSPTLISKFDSHVREIEFVKSILPIKEMVFEVGQFNTEAIRNPEVLKDKSLYGKGETYGYYNKRAYVLDRDKYTCQICKAKNVRFEVHHIIFRSNGGTDDVENLVCLCSSCHKDLHAGKVTFSKKMKAKFNLKDTTVMSTLRKMLLKKYPEGTETLGYITKENREHLNLEKEHYIDASVIASSGKKFKIESAIYLKRHVSKGDYQLAKGIRAEKKIPTGKLLGFRKWDKVSYFGKEYFIKGRRATGAFELEDIYKEKVNFSSLPQGFKTPKAKNLKRIKARSTTLCIRKELWKKGEEYGFKKTTQLLQPRRYHGF